MLFRSSSSLTLVWHSDSTIPPLMSIFHMPQIAQSSVLFCSCPLTASKDLPSHNAMTWNPLSISSFILLTAAYLGVAVLVSGQKLSSTRNYLSQRESCVRDYPQSSSNLSSMSNRLTSTRNRTTNTFTRSFRSA